MSERVLTVLTVLVWIAVVVVAIFFLTPRTELIHTF